jgi:hypothetical protein
MLIVVSASAPFAYQSAWSAKYVGVVAAVGGDSSSLLQPMAMADTRTRANRNRCIMRTSFSADTTLSGGGLPARYRNAERSNDAEPVERVNLEVGRNLGACVDRDICGRTPRPQRGQMLAFRPPGPAAVHPKAPTPVQILSESRPHLPIGAPTISPSRSTLYRCRRGAPFEVGTP